MHRVSHSVCGWVFRDRVQLVIEVQSVAGPGSHTMCFIGLQSCGPCQMHFAPYLILSTLSWSCCYVSSYFFQDLTNILMQALRFHMTLTHCVCCTECRTKFKSRQLYMDDRSLLDFRKLYPLIVIFVVHCIVHYR